MILVAMSENRGPKKRRSKCGCNLGSSVHCSLEVKIATTSYVLVIVELCVLTESLTLRWNRNREARYSNSSIHSEPGSATSPGAASGSNHVTPPSQEQTLRG